VGLALFRNGELIASSTVKGTLGTKADVLARVLQISYDAFAWVYSKYSCPTVLVAEWPQIYTRDKSKGDPNDSVPLAGVCGCLAGMLRFHPARQTASDDLECVSYLPGEWAGRTPKDETVKGCKDSPRAIKIVSRLTQSERVVWDAIKYHDAIDAVGIGLKYLGRFERRRVFHRDDSKAQ
jgi:hypothetical protein